MLVLVVLESLRDLKLHNDSSKSAMVRVIGLSPKATAGVSVLVAATAALGMAYYLSVQQRDAQLKLKGATAALSPAKAKKKGNNRPGSSKLSPTAKSATATANGVAKKAAKEKKPEPVPVRILYGTQTGTSKRELHCFIIA